MSVTLRPGRLERHSRPGPFVFGSVRVLAALVAFAVMLVGAAPGALAEGVREKQWYLDFLNAQRARQLASGGAGVTVAVVDSGVDASHPDLQGNVLPGADLTGAGTNGQVDKNGHGTSMASLIAAHGHDSNGMIGVAPNAKILPVRIEGYSDQVAEGIKWAVDHNARVINYSMGGSGSGSKIDAALEYALTNDVVVVASSGNVPEGDDEVVGVPSHPGVIAVGGVNKSGQYVPFSTKGEALALAAPATDIWSAGVDGGYRHAKGTSDSAALVSGVAALVRAKYPQLNAASVVNRLIKTAEDKGEPGRDPKYGFGVVQPVRALTANLQPVQQNPLGEVEQSSAPPVNKEGGDAGSSGTGTDPILFVVLGAFALVVLLIIALVVFLIVRASSKKKRKAQVAQQGAYAGYGPPPGPPNHGPPGQYGPPGPPQVPPGPPQGPPYRQ